MSRKLRMQTLQKLHLSNRLYIEQATCHLLMFLLSARACLESAKQNSICLKIPCDRRSSSLMETSQLICVANRLTGFFVIHEARGFCMISGWGFFRWAHGFCRFLGEFLVSLWRLCVFDGEFSRRGFGWVFCILRDVISKQIIVLTLFLFVVFDLALSR